MDFAGKRIDLVIEGNQAQLAVECDGDFWHGPEQDEKDSERQRMLERCGWQFFTLIHTKNPRLKIDMDKGKLLEMATDPRFISGIYNYCDRWCERCPFTSRCLTYATEEATFGDDPAANDINNKAYWDKLHKIFQTTMEMAKDYAKEQGIDLDSIDVEEEMKERKKDRARTRKHPLSRAAYKYGRMVDKWLDSNKAAFAEKEKELETKSQMGIDNLATLNAEAKDILDTVDVIRWYQHQIYVKINRALSKDPLDDWEELQNFPKDSDGSAKVALIGMDRSIGAWGRLREHFLEKTDDLLSILLHLDRLRRNTVKEFPDARRFIRPGFDDILAEQVP